MVSSDVLVAGITSQDAGHASGAAIFSKLAKSPSRRHKSRHSRASSGSLDADLPLPPSITSPSRTRPRPGFHRITTAPAGPVTLGALRTDNETDDGSRTPSTAAMSTGPPLVGSSSLSPQSTSTLSVGTPVMSSVNGILPQTQLGMGLSGQNQTPATLYQQIQETSRKRIATLDYLRKAHDGRSFWFTSVQFLKSDISRLPSYTPNRLSRRATNYLLLGMSIPAVLDVHSTPHPQATNLAISHLVLEYLRSLNSLLIEFESFQQLRPADGSTPSSIGRARLPSMFKRATTTRPRKSSGAPLAEIGLPMQTSVSPPAVPDVGHQHHASQLSIDTSFSGSTAISSASTLINSPPSASHPGFPAASAFPPPGPSDAPNSTLLPNEGTYTYLLTPPLPFNPDFYTVFATLCDVLIEAYQKLLQLLSSPAICTPTISDVFLKTDAKLRKVIVGGIVREFENHSREVARRELMGVQKVVFGGLMGS